MNLTRFVPNAVTQNAGKALLVARVNSPHILFGAGIVGMVGTVVLASRASLKLETVLQSTEDMKYSVEQALEQAANPSYEGPGYTIEDAARDRNIIRVKGALQLAKLYTPTVVVGVATVACLTGSHLQLNSRNNALMAAYAAVDQAYKRYQKRVAEELGEEKARELRYDTEKVVEKQINEDGKTVKVSTKRVTPDGYSQYAKFFDQLCNEWQPDPEYNRVYIESQQHYFNQLLTARGYVFLNEVYKALGIEPTKAGQVVGWILKPEDAGVDNYIDFGLYNPSKESSRHFVNGREGAVLLDFNVDGVILDKANWTEL